MITEHFADLIPPDVFQKRMITATQALLENRGPLSNADVFMNLFVMGGTVSREILWNRFEAFYENLFDSLQVHVRKIEGILPVFERLSVLPVKLVSASNPLWPEIVQQKRLAWAGLSHIRFDLITHISNMSSCKPRLAFYLEICEKIGESPESCMMVGNDMINDMICKNIGMHTYYTTDAGSGDDLLGFSRTLRRDSKDTVPDPDFCGPFIGMSDIVEKMCGPSGV